MQMMTRTQAGAGAGWMLKATQRLLNSQEWGVHARARFCLGMGAPISASSLTHTHTQHSLHVDVVNTPISAYSHTHTLNTLLMWMWSIRALILQTFGNFLHLKNVWSHSALSLAESEKSIQQRGVFYLSLCSRTIPGTVFWRGERS